MKNLENFHIIKVSYSGATNTRGSRIVMRSDRFKKSKSINYNYEFNNSLEGAQAYLQAEGFDLIGKGEGKDCYFLISTTFKSL